MSIASKLGNRFRAEFISQTIWVLSGALLIVSLARLLEPDEYGLLFLAISVFGVLNILGRLGIARSASRYIAKYKEIDSGQIPHILRFSFGLNIALLAVVGLLLLFLHEYIAVLIGEPDLVPFLKIGVFYLIFSVLFIFSRNMLQGFEAIEAGALVKGILGVSRPIIVVGLVVLGFGALGAFIGYILAYMVAVGIGLTYIIVYYYKGSEQTQRRSGLRRRIAEYSVPITATSTADVIDRHFDTILVGFFIGPTAVAFYTIGKQMVDFIEAPITALGFTLSPTYEAEKVKGNSDTAARIYEEGLFHGLLLYIPAAAGIVLVAEPLVELVFGSSYLGAVPVLQVLTVYAVALAVVRLTSTGLDFLGRARERAIAKGITTALNVVLTILLIPLFGVVGAAIATVVTYSMYTLANLYIITFELDIRIRWLFRQLGEIMVVTIILSAVVYTTAGYISGIVTLLGVVALGFAVWVILSITMGLIDIRLIKSIIL